MIRFNWFRSESTFRSRVCSAFVKGWAEFISEFGEGDTQTVISAAGRAVRNRDLLRDHLPPSCFGCFVIGGARFMANITNGRVVRRDGGPLASYLGMLPFRAVEQRVAIALQRRPTPASPGSSIPTGRIGPTLAPAGCAACFHHRIPLRGS